MAEAVKGAGVWPLGACEETGLISPQAKHCQQDLTLQNNFPITFWHAYWHKCTKTVIFSLNLLAGGARFHTSGLSDVPPPHPPAFLSHFLSTECPKEWSPDSWEWWKIIIQNSLVDDLNTLTRLTEWYKHVWIKEVVFPGCFFGFKCDVIGCFHQQVFIWYFPTLLCQKKNPQPFPINFANTTNILSPGCQSQGSGQTQRATWHWNAIITGMLSCFWGVQAAKRGWRTEAVSSRGCHSRWAWLAHARPHYRSWCWRRVTLRLPAVCYQETPP